MEIIRGIREMQMRAEGIRKEGRRIGCVPTMGYLHDAHLSLVRMAKEISDVVVVSIFVNPTQFGPGEDLDHYPRDEERDREKLIAEGVNILFMPAGDQVYPEGYQTFIEVLELSQGLCGDFRPGHFRGVATVVAKLFNSVKPHVAIFGEKDYQQLLVIRRMAYDLNFDVEVLSAPLVREGDGLAMSSRNVYLSPEERGKALSLSKALREGEALFDRGERSSERIGDTVRKRIEREGGVRLQYVEVLDGETLEEIGTIGGSAVIAVAAHVGSTRLIDNIVLGRGRR